MANRNDKELAQQAMELSFEFSRLLLVQPELAERIPENALVVFEVEQDQELSAYHRKVTEATRGPGQTLIVVHVKGLAPSRLIQPQLRPAA